MRLIQRSFGSVPVIRPVIPPMFSPVDLPLENSENTLQHSILNESRTEKAAGAMQIGNVSSWSQIPVANNKQRRSEPVNIVYEDQYIPYKSQPKSQDNKKHKSTSESAYDEVKPRINNADNQYTNYNIEQMPKLSILSNPTTHHPAKDISKTESKVKADTHFYSIQQASKIGIHQKLPHSFMTEPKSLTSDNNLDKMDIESGKVHKPSETRIFRNTHNNSITPDIFFTLPPTKGPNTSNDSLNHDNRLTLSTSSKVVSFESKTESFQKLKESKPEILSISDAPKKTLVEHNPKVDHLSPTSERSPNSENQHQTSGKAPPSSVKLFLNQEQYNNSGISRMDKGVSVSNPEPVVKVVIGRVEVKAVMQKEQKPRQAQTKPAPKLTLDGYLRSRKGGSS